MNKIVVKQINDIITDSPKVCIVLGSGLDSLIDYIKDKKIVPYSEIDGFIQTSVSGHIGQFIYGYINKIPILCAQGRFHYYEGHSFEDVGIIIKIFDIQPKYVNQINIFGNTRTKEKVIRRELTFAEGDACFSFITRIGSGHGGRN